MTSPRCAIDLLTALERTGAHPALAWYGEAARVELSGHVLANWIIKAIGHLEAEVALEEAAQMVIDMPPHWKRLVLVLAAHALGARVQVTDRAPAGPAPSAPNAALPQDGEDPTVLATDRPTEPLADRAEEVLALEARSLAPRYNGALPPLVHDWVQEVRSAPDQLATALPDWSGPEPTDCGEAPCLLVPTDGVEVLDQVLGVFLAGGRIVGPAANIAPQAQETEGVTHRV